MWLLVRAALALADCEKPIRPARVRRCGPAGRDDRNQRHAPRRSVRSLCGAGLPVHRLYRGRRKAGYVLPGTEPRCPLRDRDARERELRLLRHRPPSHVRCVARRFRLAHHDGADLVSGARQQEQCDLAGAWETRHCHRHLSGMDEWRAGLPRSASGRPQPTCRRARPHCCTRRAMEWAECRWQ